MGSGRADLPPEALRARLRVWLLARVLIVTVFLGTVAASHLTADADPEFPINAIIAMIVAAYAFSIGSVYAVPRITDLRTFAYVQVVFDILANTDSVLLPGSLPSPMGVWYK